VVITWAPATRGSEMSVPARMDLVAAIRGASRGTATGRSPNISGCRHLVLEENHSDSGNCISYLFSFKYIGTGSTEQTGGGGQKGYLIPDA